MALVAAAALIAGQVGMMRTNEIALALGAANFYGIAGFAILKERAYTKEVSKGDRSTASKVMSALLGFLVLASIVAFVRCAYGWRHAGETAESRWTKAWWRTMFVVFLELLLGYLLDAKDESYRFIPPPDLAPVAGATGDPCGKAGLSVHKAILLSQREVGEWSVEDGWPAGTGGATRNSLSNRRCERRRSLSEACQFYGSSAPCASIQRSAVASSTPSLRSGRLRQDWALLASTERNECTGSAIPVHHCSTDCRLMQWPVKLLLRRPFCRC